MTRSSARPLASAVGFIRPRGAGLFLAASLLAGCTSDAREARPEGRYGGTLVIGGPNDMRGINPLGAPELYAQEFSRFLVFLPLVRFTPELEYEPALAREWAIEGDTLVTFHLRDDVRWHDGRPTTAYDVAFTYERARDTLTAYANASYFDNWGEAEVVDSFTIRFRIRPHADPLYGWIEVTPLPRHLLDSIAPQQLASASFNFAPVGNGPFRFVSYRANDRWVLEANPDFPEDLGGRPYLDRVVWRVIPENSAQVTELLAGNVDLILSPRADMVQELDPRPDVRALVRPSRNYLFIGWNTQLPQLADARARRAITTAIDRREILVALRGGWGDIAAGPIPPFHWGYPEDVEPLPFDPAIARSLLAQAGWTNRDDDPLVENARGEELAFVLKIPAGNEFNRDVAEMIRADLEAVGVRMTTQATEFGTMVADIMNPERNFEAVLLALTNDFRINLRDSFHSGSLGGPFQLASYSNPEVDRLIDSTAVLLDREAAKPLYRRLQALVQQDQPWSFLYYYPDLRLIRERVQGADMDIRGNFATLTTWWLDETAAPADSAAPLDTTAARDSAVALRR